MAGIFITTATGKALEDQISLMDKRTNEWTMRAAGDEEGRKVVQPGSVRAGVSSHCPVRHRRPARRAGGGMSTDTEAYQRGMADRKEIVMVQYAPTC